MARLAMLHPDVEALILTDLPNPKALALIASAPPEQQAEALRTPYAVAEGAPNWTVIANACRKSTIPRAYAIFDTAKAGVAFEEDLFAEPGTADQFVTHDTAGFMAAQTAALQARVQAGRDQGQRIQLAEWQAHDIKVPHGWKRRWTDASGKPPADANDSVLLVTVSHAPTNFGTIVEAFADPPRGYHGLTSAAETEGRPEQQAPRQSAAIPARAVAGRAPVRGRTSGESRKLGTKTAEPTHGPSLDPETLSAGVRSIIARAKTAVLREHLSNPPGAHESLSLLTRCLLLALAGDNVEVNGQSRADHPRFDDLAALQVDSAGNLVELSGAALLDLLGEALSRMLVITDPATGFGSGAVAEWIARALDVPPPRLDTPEFLATLTRDQLHRICREQDPGRSMPTTVAALRKELAGRLPNWSPVAFGAAGPEPTRFADHAPSHEVESETV